MMQRRLPVILTPARLPPPKHAISELSSLGQLILASLTSTVNPPPQLPRRVDPNSYYREVYVRQFQAEPEAQPGCTQSYLSQTQPERNQVDCDTLPDILPHTPVGKIIERTTSGFNNSVFGPEVDAEEQNEANYDPPQQDTLSDMDFENAVDGNYLVSRNHTPGQERDFVNTTALPSLQSDMHMQIKKLAPRVINRVTFAEDSCVPNPHDEVMMKQSLFCNPPTAVPVKSDNPPPDSMVLSELEGIDPHLFDLSLSPILDLSSHKEENAIISQPPSDNNTNILTEVTSCTETRYEIENRIPSNDQKCNYTLPVALATGIMKETTAGPHSLQNQQNVFLAEGEILTHNKKIANTNDSIVNFAKEKVTFLPTPNATLYIDHHRNLIDEQNHRPQVAVGKNSKFLTESTELHLEHNMNQGTDMFGTLNDSICHLKAMNDGEKEKTLTDIQHVNLDVNAHPAIIERVNKLNTNTNGIIEHESVSSEKSPNRNLEFENIINESVDIFAGTDVTLQNKTEEYNNKEKLYAGVKDTTLKSQVSEAMNESVEIFNTLCDTTPHPKFRAERKEECSLDQRSDKPAVLPKIAVKPQVFRGLEHTRFEDRTMTPKKPIFRAPYKIVSESPIIGYPPNRRNITSTPKQTQKKKVLMFGSGYSSDSSDTNDGIRNSSYCKTKHSTAKGDTREGESSSTLYKNSERKLDFKLKFLSKLSSSRFSVQHLKKKQNADHSDQSCYKEKNSTEVTKLSYKPKIYSHESLNVPALSTAKPNVSETTGLVHSKAKDKFEICFNKKMDKLQNSKVDMIQEISVSAITSKEPPNTADSGDTCYKTVDKYTRKLNKFKFSKDQPNDTVISENISKTKESSNFHGVWQDGMEASEKANSHMTKQSVTAKSLFKSKKEDQVHMTAKKKRKINMTESYIACQELEKSKKTRKRKSSSVSKNTSDNQSAKKSKEARRFLGSCESKSKKCKSGKNDSLFRECSQSTVNLSQVGLVQLSLGNEAQLLAVSDYLTSAQEFCVTLLYRDCSSQLREKVLGGRKQHPGSGQVTGFALRATWTKDSAPPLDLLPTGHGEKLTECQCESLGQECGNGRTSCSSNGNISAVYRISLGINFNKEEIRSVVSCIMKSEVRKIGFDAQESITFLVEKLEIDHREVISSWVILDPKIGGWLMNSDHPPVTFHQTAVALKVSLMQAGIGQRPDEEIHRDMEALSLVAAALHTRLLQLNLWTIFMHLEMRITPILAVMELRDIRVDKAILKQMGQRLKLKIEEMERRCHQVSGSVFNVASHAQLRSVLYQELKLDLKAGVTVPRTTKGQKSTCEAALGRLGNLHPLPGLVLQHRLLNKLKTTYVDGILACLHGSSVRAAWEQTSASTGRIQCRHPNLQNIPKQPVTVEIDGNEMVVRARECFCSREGYMLVSADFQQTELRVLAHLSQEAVLLTGFRQPNHNNTDIFKQLSATWLDKTVSEVTSNERERTKRVVYAVMYGAGKEKLSEVLHIAPSEAHDIISSFMKRFPGIPAYMKSVIEVCRQQGFLTTIFRRRRFFPGIISHDATIQSQSERQAVNFIIQGSAADLSKAAMVQTEAVLARWPDIDAKLLIHIHDELVWEVHTEHMLAFCEMVGRIMEDTQQLCGPLVQLTVPLPITVSTGTSWAHMQPLGRSRSEPV